MTTAAARRCRLHVATTALAAHGTVVRGAWEVDVVSGAVVVDAVVVDAVVVAGSARVVDDVAVDVAGAAVGRVADDEPGAVRPPLQDATTAAATRIAHLLNSAPSPADGPLA